MSMTAARIINYLLSLRLENRKSNYTQRRLDWRNFTYPLLRCGDCTMGKLIYLTPTSLDGFIADESGNLDWSAPDEEVFAFINDLLRPVTLHLYGRKMYQTLAVW